MKIAIPFLSAALLVGGFVAAGNADVLSKTESAPGDNYCHLRFTAITADSLVTNHPISKGPELWGYHRLLRAMQRKSCRTRSGFGPKAGSAASSAERIRGLSAA